MSEKTRYGNAPAPPTGPDPGKIPDKKTLMVATLLAAGFAFLLFMAFILPAEFGKDPTGVGRLTGISDLYHPGAELDLGGGTGTVHRSEPQGPRNDTVTIELQGLSDNEYKFHLEANQTMLYSWTATGLVDFDFHGDPDNPSRPGEFASYDASQGTGGSGSFQAPFSGRHGWYFQNVSPEPVTITL